jgi:hypothetical protein
MTPDQITFELSGGAANSDPLLSFGGAKSGTPVEELQSTVTTNQGPDLSIFFDSARIGDGDGTHVDKWILFITGPNALSAARVIDFRSADGRFQLEFRMPSTSVVGNIYRLFDLNSLFHEVTEAECASGHTDYRLVYCTNTSGDAATKWQGYLRDVGIGPSWAGVDFEIFSKENSSPVEGTPANEETPPAGLDAVERFTRTLAYYGFPSPQPFRQRTHAQGFGGGTWRAIYVKRIVPENQRRQPFAVCMIVVEMLDAGLTTVSCGCLLPFGLLGFTPEIAITRDRGPILTGQQLADGYDSAIRVGHGARFAAEIRAQETGLVVPDLEVGWSLDGPGQIWTPPGPITDVNGVAKATYSAPGQSEEIERGTITFHNSGTQFGEHSDVQELFWGWWTHQAVPDVPDRLLAFYTACGTVDDPPSDNSPYILPIWVKVNASTSNPPRWELLGYENAEHAATAHTPTGLRIDTWLFRNPPVGKVKIGVRYAGVCQAIFGKSALFSGVDQVNPLDIAGQGFVSLDDAGTTITHNFVSATPNALAFGTGGNGRPVDVTVASNPGQTTISASLVGDAPNQPLFVNLAFKQLPTPGADSMGWSGMTAGSDKLGTLIVLRAAPIPAILTGKV